MKLYGIVGAGGFGREVMPMAEGMLKTRYPNSQYKIVFIDQNTHHSIINNYPVMSIEEFFSQPATEKYFNIAIANYETRKNIANTMIEKGATPFRISAVNSIELANNNIEEGALLCAFTTITSNVKIGKFFHANIYSYVAHDCIIGDYVTFAPRVHCNGNIIIEDNVYVGTGVIIKQGTPQHPLRIGQGAIIGMGAVVTKDVAANETVVGNPARPFIRKPVSEPVTT
jgi:sugar O-acyltransferase (sialic acid O-acetyltransferase NeuD family)